MLLSTFGPSPFASISPAWFTFGLVLVIAFAWTRPMTVRDFENRRLPVNAIAQVGFTLVYCLAYLTLVLMVHYARPLLSGFFMAVGAIEFATRTMQPRADAAGGFAPLFSLTILCWFQSLSLLREVERTILVYVYSARYRHNDVMTLGRHFVECPHNPTSQERAKNRQVLEDLNVVLTDSDTRKLDLRVIGDWRKVETLLRHLRTWRAEGKLSLTPDELVILDKVETAHERKTALALNIVRMLDHLARGGGTNATFQQVTDLLAAAKGKDPDGIAAAEARLLAETRVLAETRRLAEAGSLAETPAPETARQLVQPAADATSAAQPELRLSSAQLKQFLAQIETYFLEEYRILLTQVGDLAAKGIVHAADQAGPRLESMKQVGFEGLGELLPMRFDRTMLVFLATFGASLALFLFRTTLGQWTGERNPVPAQVNVMMLATVSLTIALATITGAFVGSTRELAQAPRTPWACYVLAGLFAVAMFLVVHTARVSLGGPAVASSAVSQSPSASRATVAAPSASSSDTNSSSPAATSQPGLGQNNVAHTRSPPFVRPPTFRQSLPWAVLPFMLTLGICLLARVRHWPIPRLSNNAVAERLLDGAALGVILVVTIIVMHRAVYPMIEANPALEMSRPAHIAAAWRQSMLPFVPLAMMFGLGFAIGAMVLRDVRRAAHSRIVIGPISQPPAIPPAVVKSVP
ncbi:MAG: hypothetical protein K2Y05_05135, partial [Hyphomicrobiaceae bacterium]|nr:hypothetical protein [Hyphomicrobiaceae bacterium]